MPQSLRHLVLRRACFVACLALVLSTFRSAAAGAQGAAMGAAGMQASSAPDKLDETVAQAQAAGQYAAAASAYAKATSLDPSIPELWANRGLMEHLAGQPRSAIASFGHALAVKPNLSTAVLFTGIDFAALNQPRQAIPWLDRALRLQPANPDALLALGKSYTATGHFNEAIAALEKAVVITPASSAAWLSLAVARLALIDRDGGRLARDHATDPWTQALYAQDLLIQGRTSEAVDAFHQAAVVANPRQQAIFAALLTSSTPPQSEVPQEAITRALARASSPSPTRPKHAPKTFSPAAAPTPSSLSKPYPKPRHELHRIVLAGVLALACFFVVIPQGSASLPIRSQPPRSSLTERLALPNSLPVHRIRAALFVLLLLSLRSALAAPSQVKLFPLPAEVRSTHYRVTINGRPADVLHAASSYYMLNFDSDGPVTVSVTADDPHFWDRGVEVQPMRFGIRPVRRGATITFPMSADTKLIIARPGDHFADADMLFLFANPRETPPDLNGIRYFGPGLHRENIDVHTGDRVYLDGGAVILGAVNIWQVKDIRIFGRGTVIYDGPQDPHTDQGWMHKPNWHCMVMDSAENIEVDGITCITRSRSWQIQMSDSRHIGLYNIKVIGGNLNDANQDGLDWLGGGDTTVRNSFFRASDDVFALQGNGDFYDPNLLRKPGHDVTNITIENTIASTSISNTIRVGWPEKTFNSAHFIMRDVDVTHTGFGGCKVPFAFFELWADPDGHGRHEDYDFQNIRLEDWYSLFQVRQPAPQAKDIHFADIWAMDGPGMVPPVVKGDVEAVTLTGVPVQGYRSALIEAQGGAQMPRQEDGSLLVSFTYPEGILRAKQLLTFTATTSSGPALHYEWIFGDGAHAAGRVVKHRFSDADGTLLDGSGQYRVLLHVTGSGRETWSRQSLVIEASKRAGVGNTFMGQQAGVGSRAEIFNFDVPADGGYTFTWLTSSVGAIAVDDLAPVETPKGRPQVCGAPGNAVQPVHLGATLRKGTHRVSVVWDPLDENARFLYPKDPEAPVLLWEGPGTSRQQLILSRGALSN